MVGHSKNKHNDAKRTTGCELLSNTTPYLQPLEMGDGREQETEGPGKWRGEEGKERGREEK